MIWVGRIVTAALLVIALGAIQALGVYLIRFDPSYSWREAAGCALVIMSGLIGAFLGVWVSEWWSRA